MSDGVSPEEALLQLLARKLDELADESELPVRTSARRIGNTAILTARVDLDVDVDYSDVEKEEYLFDSEEGGLP